MNKNFDLIVSGGADTSHKFHFDSSYSPPQFVNFVDFVKFPEIDQKHWDEWLSSAVAPDIIALNVRSLSGDLPYEHLLYSEKLERRNDGRVTARMLWRYRHVENGGWWVSGLDPLGDWGEMLWGQFKPNAPFIDPKKQKPIKYEAPPKTATRAFFLRVSRGAWEAVAKRAGVSVPPQIEETESGEAIGFWQWIVEQNIPVTITEGAKKAAALLSAGYAAVALPGVYSGYRSDEVAENLRRLIPDLAVIATSGREIHFCFDYEVKPQTRQNVAIAIGRTGKLFADAGCKVFVDELPGSEKGVDDFLTVHGSEALNSVRNAALPLLQWRGKEYSSLTYEPNIILNQRYLDNLPLPEFGLIGIKSPKGTGKTQALIPLVRDWNGEGKRVLVITHRIQLGRAICDSLGIEWIDENGRDSQEKSFFGLGLCFDSLWKLDPEDFEGAIIILDEVEQSLWHALNARTCAGDRVKILATFKALLKNAELVIAQDADLSDVSLDFLKGVMEVEPHVVFNGWRPEQGAGTTFYQCADPTPLLQDVDELIAAGSGAVMICTDAQKAKSKWGTVNLETRFKMLFPEKRILRIDSESVADPDHPAYGCIEKLNEVLSGYDILVVSPTLGTGVSIDLKGHFAAVAGIFQGAIPVTEAAQFLARVREFCPRFVWAKTLGLGQIGNGSACHWAIKSGKVREVQQNIFRLRNVDFDLEAAIDGAKTNYDSYNLSTWARMAARVNCGRIDYRDNLQRLLETDGHDVNVIEAEKIAPINDAQKIIKATNQRTEAEAIESAEPLDKESAQQLADKRSKTTEERQRIRKREIEDRYGIPATAELIAKDDDKWYSKIRLHYFLTHSPEFVEDRDRRHLEQHLAQGEGKLCPQDVRLLKGQVDLLKAIGILDLLDTEREVRASDEDIQRMVAHLASHSRDVKNLLGITVSKKLAEEKPIQIVQLVLGKLGLKMKCACRERTGSDIIRVYKLSSPEDGREQVFEAWSSRDLESLMKENVSTPVIEDLNHLSRVGSQILSLINNGSAEEAAAMLLAHPDQEAQVWAALSGEERQIFESAVSAELRRLAG